MSSKKNKEHLAQKNTEQTAQKNTVKDAFKKILASGSATEISKELFQSAVGQVQKTKSDISEKVTQEILTLIKKIDFVKEFSQFAEDHKFKVTAEIEIIKKKKS